MRIALTGLFVAALGLAGCATEIGTGGPESVDVVDGWESLGSARVSLAETSATIDLAGGRSEFKELRIETNTPVKVSGLRVGFANGETWASTKALKFDKDGSHTLALPDDDRVVDSVALDYSSDDLGDGRATIKIAGR